MSPRTRFTDAQIKHVLHLYTTISTTAAYEAGKPYGMKPSRIRQLAFNRGIRAKIGEECRWRPTRDVHNDARWARAVAVGPVLA